MEILWPIVKYTIFLPWIIWAFICKFFLGGAGSFIGHITAFSGYVYLGTWLIKKCVPSKPYYSNYDHYDRDYDYDYYDDDCDDDDCDYDTGRDSYQGCCSWHGGIDHIDHDCGIYCNDGSTSPSS